MGKETYETKRIKVSSLPFDLGSKTIFKTEIENKETGEKAPVLDRTEAKQIKNQKQECLAKSKHLTEL